MQEDTYERALQELGDRLKTYRNQLGLTIEQAAARTCVSSRYLTSLEHGRANITLITAAQICAALGINPLVWLEAFWHDQLRQHAQSCPYGRHCCARKRR